MARFPVMPRYVHMLCRARERHVLQHAVCIVAALTAKEVFMVYIYIYIYMYVCMYDIYVYVHFL